jgi:outer membrane protein OmpA-like peptidoglycan-associated protein
MYRGNKDFGSFYKTSLKGDKWKTPTELSSKYNSEYHETSLTYSFDNKLMFIISDDPQKGIGGKDIYMSLFNGKTWSKPENVGPVINTPYDEEGIYLAPDNKTLYFSSKGHNSIGGYDVFKSELRAEGIWTAPVNIGIPINTPYDDLFYKPALNGRFAYYSSVNDSLNYGGLDIYEVFFFIPKPLIQSHEDNLLASQLNPSQETMIEKTLEIKTIRLTIVEGLITSSSGEAVEAAIQITDLANNSIVSQINSNSASGKYLVTLLPGTNYSMNIKALGYLFHSENFNIPDTSGYQKIKIDIELQKVAIGAKVVLKNVFFDTGKATLRTESFDELDRLITFMNENPTVKIEIGGHTDNIGSFASNQKLSKDRAQAVVDYLLLKGVNPDRLEAMGYSSSKAITDNKTEEGKQQNRRVEARVIGY